jgi:hypothetical protein
MGKSRKNTDFGFMVTREMAGEWVENIKKTDPEGWKDAASGLEGHDDVTWILQEYISESGADFVAEIEDEDDFVRFDEILLPNPDGTYDKSDVKPLYIITSDTDRNYFGEENNKEAVESVKNTMRTLHAPESFEPLYEKNTGYVEESVAELIPEDDEEPSVSAKDIRELFKRTLDSMKEYPTIFLNDGAHTIVQCGKCAYCKDYNNGATHVFECTHPDHRRYAEEGTELHSPNWFCADGETKEKETDD